MGVSNRSRRSEAVILKESGKMPYRQLRGYIFVCNQDTTPHNIEHYLRGLLQRNQGCLGERNPGLPHFLYNPRKQRLYGVFKASSESGSRHEFDTWERKSSRKNGTRMSRYHTQVNVHICEAQYPLDVTNFNLMPCNDNVAEFRSELSQPEVEGLLKILGAPSYKRSDKGDGDENDGEWEKVKSKSKTKRQLHSDISKEYVAPNRLSGRKQGAHASGLSQAECHTGSYGRNAFQFGVGRGRSHESRADMAENWRSDSAYRNRPSSMNISSSNALSSDDSDTQLDKGQQSAYIAEIPSLDCVDHDLYQDYGISETSDSAETIKQTDYISTDSGSLRCGGQVEFIQKPSMRSSFESYSAALKSGMYDDMNDSGIVIPHVTPSNERNFSCRNGGISTDTCSSPGSIDGFPSSPVSGLCWGEVLADPSQFQSGIRQKHAYSSDESCSPLCPSDTSDEQVKQEQSLCSLSDGDDLSGFGTRESFEKKQNVSELSRFGCGNHAAPAGHDRQRTTLKAVSNTSLPPKACELSKFTIEIPTYSYVQDVRSIGTRESGSTPNPWIKSSLSSSERFQDTDPAVNSVTCPFEQQHVVENHEQGSSYEHYRPLTSHEKLESPRLSESNQCSTSASSQAHSNKPRTLKVFRQARRVQESSRPFTEELDKQHKQQLQIQRSQSHNERKENNAPTWYFNQNQVGYNPIPAGFSGSLSCLPTVSSSSFTGYENGEYDTDPSYSSHVGDISGSRISSTMDPDIPGPAQHVQLSMQSPILLLLPVFSPVVGTLPSVLPLPPPVRSGSTYAETLHADILEFARKVRPTLDARARVELALECVIDAVQQLWPGADIEVFGSFSTGLCLSHSDVDVAVILPPSLGIANSITTSRSHARAPRIRELAASLRNYSWCESLATIETAAMPVIKLQCRPVARQSPEDRTNVSPIAIDITIGGKLNERTKISHTHPEMYSTTPRVAHNGAAAREYVVGKLRQLPALAPLALVMKSYLHHQHLNDVYSGGLGSFSLTLLLVFYLERVSSSYGLVEKVPPFQPFRVIPFVEGSSIEALDDNNQSLCTHDTSSSFSVSSEEVTSSKLRGILERADQVVTEALDSMESSITPNLGTLLLGFLHTFGHLINLSLVRLVLKGAEGSPCGIIPREPTSRPAALWVDDPLNPGANVGAGSFNMWHVQAAMRDMLYVLTKPNSANNFSAKLDMASNRHLLDELFVTDAK